MMNRKKILLLTGSMNQTTQMMAIANELKEYDCWFSQLFTDNIIINFLLNKTRLLDKTIISKPFRIASEQHLRTNNCKIDYKAVLHHYDLVIFCSDMIVPKRMQQSTSVWIQEGMIDKLTWASKLIKTLKLPTVLCLNTSLNGTSNKCDLYCTASEGYKNYIIKHGTEASKVNVTGIPNYDNAEQYLDNNFLHHNYVMVATSDIRETARTENRDLFLKECVEIANGRQLLFKLHPNENKDRAIKEIKSIVPENTLIFTDGNTHEMIANCAELITQYSTVVYTGISLGKKVHSWFDVETLKMLEPQQNKGTSTKNIAAVCRKALQNEEVYVHPTLIHNTSFNRVTQKESVYAG